MRTPSERPWWADLIPDIRAWSTAAMFGVVVFILSLIAEHPELQDNELFKTLATLLVGTGGFGLVCAFLWGGSKATTAAIDTVNDMAKRPPPALVADLAPGAPEDAPPWERQP